MFEALSKRCLVCARRAETAQIIYLPARMENPRSVHEERRRIGGII